jgi:drug/metabolite transporter (DMT)-like permease
MWRCGLHPLTPVNDVLRGIAAMVASQLAFLLNDTCVKLASETLPMGEIVFLRGLVALLLTGSVLVVLGAHRHLAELADRLVGYRVVGELGAVVFYIAALIHMPIANATIIFQATPLCVTAGAALVLGEAVGWRRWAAIGIGFLGVLVVVRPGLSGFDAYGILVLIAVLFVTGRDLATRALPASISTILLSFVTTAAVTVAGATFAIFEEWKRPSAASFAEIVAAAALLSVGYITVIIAMRRGDMSVTASFRYTAVVFAIVSGFLVWGDVPDGLTIFGSLVIVLTGLYTLYREHRLARAGRPLIAAPAAIDPPTGG